MQKHGYRFQVLRLRRWIAAVDPGVMDRLGYAGLVALSLWTYLYGLDGYGIINGNESLYVESAREMALSGEWALPTLNGLPYLEKPPLFIWLITAAASLGGSGELPPRLVTAAAALLLTLGVVRCSAQLDIGKRGFAAGFILVMSLGMNIMSRVAMPDMALTAFFALGCLAFLAALQADSRARLRMAAGMLGAASLVKGALPLLLFGLIALAYYVIEPTRRESMRRLAGDPIAALLLLLPLCLWLVAIEAKLPGAAYHVVVNEHICRFLGKREPHDYYSGSPLYYVPRLFLFFFPWVGVLLFGWLGRSRNVDPAKQRIRRFLWLCVWIPFGFFSLSGAKANYYILVCLPPMALLTADYIPDLLRERRRFHLAMAVVIPIMLFVAAWAYRIWEIRAGRTAPIVFLRDGSGPLTVAVLVLLAVGVLLLILAGWRRVALLCLGGLLVPISLQIDHLIERADPFISSRTMANAILDSYAGMPVYIFEDFEAVGALPIYLGRTVPVIDSKSNDLYFGRQIQPRHASFISTDEVLERGGAALVVVAQDRLKDFATSPLASKATELQRIGRARLFRIAS